MQSMSGRVNVSASYVRRSGFTMLEFLFVTAIISILAMIAVPFYQVYRSRVKVAGELGLIEPVKKRMLEVYMTKSEWPVNNEEALLDDAGAYTGNYLTGIEVSDTPQPGTIILSFDSTKLPALGENNILVFYPVTVNGGSVSWACDQGTMDDNFRPPNCR